MRDELSTNTLSPILDTILLVSKTIEDIAKEKDISLIEASVLYCEENDLEIEYLGEIISKNQCLLARIQQEAEDLHYIKKSARLFS